MSTDTPRRWPLALLTGSLRLLAMAAFGFVALGFLERSPFAPPRYALVLDDSPSVERLFPGFVAESADLWRGFRGGLLPVIAAGDHPRPARTTPAAPLTARATDLLAALRATAALGSPGVEMRILLATDGFSRDDGLEGTIRELRNRGAKVWALTTPAERLRARAIDIVLPERVFLAETFGIRARLQATQPGPLRVRLERNGVAVAEATVIIDRFGRGQAEFFQELERVGRTRFAVHVLGPAGADSAPAVGEVSVASVPRVRWIADDPATATPLLDSLRDAGITVEIARPEDLADPGRDLASADVIVLDDLPAAALTDDFVEAVRGAVGTRGAGLIVLGGRKGLGSGAYAGTVIESLLPAKSGFQIPPAPPAVSLVLALDTSFSMFFRGSGEKAFYSVEPRKIDVAKESAREVVRAVRPGDRLGIIGNSDTIFWIVPLGEIADRAPAIEQIDRVFPAGGGIYFYSVLHEAREALRGAPEGLRHVLVLCDAEDIDQYEVTGRGHSFDLVREMAREGITLTILAIGRPWDKDVPFLRTAALLGRGDFYLVPRVVALPRYFVSEYRRLTSGRFFVEEEVQPAAGEQTLSAASELPPLTGLALLTAREGSRTLLHSGFGAPLLIAGRYGRGRTAVFAGDNGYRWASRWVGAPTIRRFWLQLLFDAAPAVERGPSFASYLVADSNRGELRFQYSGIDGDLPPWEDLWALAPGGVGDAPIHLARTGLHSYRGFADWGNEGFRRVIIAEDQAGTRPLLTGGYTVPIAVEDLPVAPRWDLVERLTKETGGGWVHRPEEMAPAPGSFEILRPVLPPLLIAAGVLLLLVETAIRTMREE